MQRRRILSGARSLVCALLSAALLFECAQLGLVLRVSPAVSVVPATEFRVRNPTFAADIVHDHLFGVAEEQSTKDPDSAPLSEANLVLAGTLATDSPTTGLAIITKGGVSQLFRPGDVISEAALRLVFLDHVILSRGGRLERLELPKYGHRADSALTHAPSTVAPQQIADVANVSVATQLHSTKVRGFIMQRRGDSEAFIKSGLRQGELVTAVNGYSLVGIEKDDAQPLLEQVMKATQASLTVVRTGTPIDIDLNVMR